jgi:hypothetical protein
MTRWSRAAVAVAVVRARLAVVDSGRRRIAAGSLRRIVVAALLLMTRRTLASFGARIGTGFGVAAFAAFFVFGFGHGQTSWAP